MLAPDQRLRDGGEFRRTVRRGRRSASPLLVVHLLAPVEATTPPARAGLVVSRAVGNAVTRNRVKRRLRHLLRPAMSDLDAGSTVVVRALPGAATADSAELGRDLTRCLTRAARTGAA